MGFPWQEALGSLMCVAAGLGAALYLLREYKVEEQVPLVVYRLLKFMGMVVGILVYGIVRVIFHMVY